jgi:iron complex outermembrane receptor protein
MRRVTQLRITVTASAVLTGLAIGAGPVAAQTTAEPPGVIGLEEIVVTAQRRSENLQRAAIAVTAVTAEDVARAGVTEATQLTRIAPALQIGSSGGTLTQYYVRGVGNTTNNSLSDAAVSMNLDGVPIVRSTAVEGLFYDLDRIEVLKGPQGTLYGRNATGGAVNVITTKPSLGAYSGYVNAEIGNYDAIKLQGAVNIPIGDKLAVRVAGITSSHDGYLSDGTSDEDTQAVRVQATYEPNEDFKLTFGGDYAKIGGEGVGTTFFGIDRDDRIGSTDPRAGVVISNVYSPLAGAFLSPLPTDNYMDNTYWGVFAQADVQTPLGALTVLPSYRKSDVDYVAYPGVGIHDRMKNDQLTFEARIASDDAQRLSYLLGVFYLDESVKQTPGYDQQYFNAHGLFDTDTTSYAAFGRLTFKVTDDFRLTGGIRYTMDEKKGLLDAYQLIVVCPAGFFGGNCIGGTPGLPRQRALPPGFTFPNGDPIPVQPWGTSGAIVTATRVINRASQDFTKTTYRVGFEYDLRPESLLYATYETGFKAGGFFNSIDSPVYKPETIDAFTLGSKNRFWDNRLQLNLEAFFWKYKDQQVSHFRLNSIGGSEYVTENVGETEIKGLEVEAKALVTETTTLSATVQYLDAERTEFTYTNPASNGPPVTGCPFALTGAVYTINCSGTDAVNAPTWTINAGLEQGFELSGGHKLTFNADLRYQTSYYAGFEELPQQKEKGYTILDLQLQYQPPGDQWSVAVFGNNVTDEEVVNFANLHPFGPGLVSETLRPPRTYGVRVNAKF